MLIERLQTKFKPNEPIFTPEILEIMSDYSRQRVYQLISKAENEGRLIKYDTGIYYLPKTTQYGNSVPTVNSIVDKKYIKNSNEIFGIYGRYVIENNFLISYQIPNTIEVITNNESRRVRRINIRGRDIILRKPYLPITKENVYAYTIMELFNNLNIKQYQENIEIRNSVIKYIEENQVTQKDIMNLANAFPARALKKLIISGVLYEITR